MAARALRLGVVQAASVVGRPDVNAATVAELLTARLAPLAQAAPRPTVVLLPEAFMQGYTYDVHRAWSCVDAIDGVDVPHARDAPASHALCALAAHFGVYLGTTVMERVRRPGAAARGEVWDVLNTFVLAQPDGTLARDRCPKVHPANFEAFVFRGGVRRACGRTVTTPLGRLGVAICYDNYFATTLAELAAAAPDVLLLPHCAPAPRPSRLGMHADEIARYSRNLAATATRYAAAFNVPVAYTNPTGTFDSPCPAWYLRPMEDDMTRNSTYAGGGQVVAAGGTQLAALGATPDAAFADVTLPPVPAVPSDAAARAAPATRDDDAITPTMRAVFPFNEWMGRRWYEAHAAQRTAAVLSSSTSPHARTLR